MEHEFYPTPDQVEVAHKLAEMGIDAIFGHHPHVIQPVEYYTTKRDCMRIVPIFYSLGNLINPFCAPYLSLSYLALLELVKGRIDHNNWKTYVRNVDVKSIVQVVNEEKEQISLHCIEDLEKIDKELFSKVSKYNKLFSEDISA